MPEYNKWFAEHRISNFSGHSTVTKPTTGGGNKVLNGSRWREVDTGKVFYYDLRTDVWYETDHYIKSVSGAAPIVDIRSLDLLEQILTTLKKIEYHLFLASDTELKDQDV